jgi:hypothetical protein
MNNVQISYAPLLAYKKYGIIHINIVKMVDFSTLAREDFQWGRIDTQSIISIGKVVTVKKQ